MQPTRVKNGKEESIEKSLMGEFTVLKGMLNQLVDALELLSLWWRLEKVWFTHSGIEFRVLENGALTQYERTAITIF